MLQKSLLSCVGCCQDLLSLMAITLRATPVLSVTIQKFHSRYMLQLAFLVHLSLFFLKMFDS